MRKVRARDDRRLRGLGDADTCTGDDERAEQERPGLEGQGEGGVGDRMEQGSGREGARRPRPVDPVPAEVGHQRGDQVVRRVDEDREGGGISSGAAVRLEEVGRAEDEERRGHVGELEHGDRHHGAREAVAPQRTQLHTAPCQRRRDPPPRLRRGHADGGGCEEAGYGGQVERVTNTDPGDEPGGEQRSDDGAEVVARTFEAVGAPVGPRLRERGEQRVTSGGAYAAGRPGRRAGDPDLPHRRRRAERARGDGGDDVAACGHAAAAFGLVCERPGDELGDSRESVGDAFDEAERPRRGAKGRRDGGG
jgi:hypothetical protein